MIVGITYGDNNFINSRKKCKESMELYLDNAILFTKNDLDKYKDEYPDIINGDRGGGYWIYKSIFLNKVINDLNYGDGLMWVDAGIEVIRDPKFLYDIALDNDGFCLFKQPFKNSKYCKRDSFFYMGVDTQNYYDNYQCDASIQFYIKNDKTIKFLSEYLEYSSDARIITDTPNKCGKPNYPDFIDHRHDQSILSLLSIRYNLNRFKCPTQYMNGWSENENNILNDYEKKISNKYSMSFNHHRIRK